LVQHFCAFSPQPLQQPDHSFLRCRRIPGTQSRGTAQARLSYTCNLQNMQPGILLALTSAVLFGASTPFAKLLLGSVEPWPMAGLLYLGAGIGLAVVHVSRGVLRLQAIEAPLRRPDVPWLAAVILFGGMFGPLLLLLGLARADATAASLLLNLEGLATMGIAWVVFRENVDRRLLLGAFAILAGAVLLSWRGQASFQWSGLLIAGACLCWGIDNNLTRKLSSSDPVQIAMLKGLVAGAVNLTLALWQGAVLPSASTVAAVGIVGFLGYGVSLALFVLGLRYLGTARTGAYFSLAPFVGAFLAVVMLGEPLSVQLIIAGGLMAFGLWLHLAERHEHEHLHEPMEHEHRHHHDEHHQHEHPSNDPSGEPHTHWHRHARLVHRHPHYPDLHHRHGHRHAS
jgi:drug/metabolite transporter (DMT)-like permease